MIFMTHPELDERCPVAMQLNHAQDSPVRPVMHCTRSPGGVHYFPGSFQSHLVHLIYLAGIMFCVSSHAVARFPCKQFSSCVLLSSIANCYSESDQSEQPANLKQLEPPSSLPGDPWCEPSCQVGTSDQQMVVQLV